MSTDILLNAAALTGAAAVFVFGGYGLYTLQEAVEKYIRRKRAPKPPQIIFRVGYGPPSPTNPKWKS